MSGPDKFGPGREADIKQRQAKLHQDRERYSEAREGGNVHRHTHWLLRKKSEGGSMSEGRLGSSDTSDKITRKIVSNPEFEKTDTERSRAAKHNRDTAND